MFFRLFFFFAEELFHRDGTKLRDHCGFLINFFGVTQMASMRQAVSHTNREPPSNEPLRSPDQ